MDSLHESSTFSMTPDAFQSLDAEFPSGGVELVGTFYERRSLHSDRLSEWRKWRSENHQSPGLKQCNAAQEETTYSLPSYHKDVVGEAELEARTGT